MFIAMCLIFIGYRCHQEFPLFVAANRDEFFARETRQAHHWGNGVIAGRDGRAGGTWLGIGPNSRFAAITNRRGSPPKEGLRSRGELTANFLHGSMSAHDYAQSRYKAKTMRASIFWLAMPVRFTISLTTNTRHRLGLLPATMDYRTVCSTSLGLR